MADQLMKMTLPSGPEGGKAGARTVHPCEAHYNPDGKRDPADR